MNKTRTTLLVLMGLYLSGCIGTKKNTPNASELLNPNTYQLFEVSENVSYAYTQEEPVKVGGFAANEGRLSQRRYLNALTGPNEENVTYKHINSCCYEKKELSEGNVVLTYLDKFELSIEGKQQKYIIFISTFEKGKMLAPKGFSFKIPDKK